MLVAQGWPPAAQVPEIQLVFRGAGVGETWAGFINIDLSTCSGSQSEVPGPSASAPPENLLEMRILRSHPRPAESGSLRVGPSSPCHQHPQVFTVN